MTEIDRTKFIGSSEIASVLGLSRWKTPLELWAEKTGEVDPPDLSDNEYVEWGTRLEEPVAQKFAEEHDLKLMAYKKRYYHKEYDFLSCELDRIIVGTDEIVECKTCDARKTKEWEEDEIPTEYILQVMFALGISGRKKGWIAVLIGGNKYRERVVEFDQEFYDDIVHKAVKFWENNIVEGIPPKAMAGDSRLLSDLYPDNTEDIIENGDLDKYVGYARRVQNVKDQIKELKKERKQYENKIKEFLKERQGFRTDNVKCTWKKQSRTYPDSKKMKNDDIFEDYKKESSFRVLRINIKENEDE